MSAAIDIENIEPHRLAIIFPELDDGKIRDLADDIRQNGLQQPIVMFEGRILDGRNRLTACKIAGVEPEFKEFEGDDPLAHVISLNLHRRHLSESQRAMVAGNIANIQLGENQHSNEGTSIGAASEMLNVGRKSVGCRSNLTR